MLNTLNRQFFYIFGTVMFVLIVGWEALSRAFGNTPFAQSLNFILFGVVFLAGDIIARRRDTEPFTWLSILNSYRGGAFGWVPCWLVGVGFIGAGVASLVQ